ncbi:prepilin-type N-terminal cleavage/methylation domain-containing protein [uncultured Gimesia sp.]|uniref:prepilin-type N-terminal cleavage/methylation domain-containing protein n=1 Tax=uncultured Gimesia sp. TaxID=1678688 RepID=UPI00260DB14E|nr:prepilin-type N-terminal cleavage/methylation domain-containing protein [uncultured Gimesia sp.]
MPAFHMDNLVQLRLLQQRRSSGRSGFTLVELLVVISILAILVVMTVSSINFALSSDLTRGASRQVQSYLAGARDRAIYAKEPRGVRFLIDPNNPTVVTSMVYIAPSPDWNQGVIRIERIDTDSDTVPDTALYVRGKGTDWRFLYNRGQLLNGARIKIPGDGSGTWYSIDLDNSPISEPDPVTPGSPLPNEYDFDVDEVLRLTTPYRDAGTSTPTEVVAFAPGSGPSTYLLELPPVVLSGEEPTLLPNNTGIDLDRSFLPASWRVTGFSGGDDGQPGKAGVNDDGNGGNDDAGEYLWPGTDDYRLYSSQLDLMFSPRGSLSGSEAGSGKIHFMLDTLENISSTWLGTTGYASGDRVTVPARFITPTSTNWDLNFRPYDRIYVCDTAGTSGSNPAIFLNSNAARTEGSTITDGSVTWKVELNSTPSLLTIFTRTGNVSAYPMFFDNPVAVPLNRAPDVFYYAETGETAK